MYVMFDTVTLGELPSFANTSRDAVAGYVDGLYDDIGQVIRHDPAAHHLSIAVRASDVADCLDIENGDARPDEAPGWWHRAVLHGIWRPCLYASKSTMGRVYEELRKAGIHRASYRVWTAHYTGVPHIEPGSDATQWTDRAMGRNLDESLCVDDFFPHPHPAHAAALQRVDVAELTYAPATGHWSVDPRPAREVRAA